MYARHCWGTSECAHVYTKLLYLRTALTDCVRIWSVESRNVLAASFPHVGSQAFACVTVQSNLLCLGIRSVLFLKPQQKYASYILDHAVTTYILCARPCITKHGDLLMNTIRGKINYRHDS